VVHRPSLVPVGGRAVLHSLAISRSLLASAKLDADCVGGVLFKHWIRGVSQIIWSSIVRAESCCARRRFPVCLCSIALGCLLAIWEKPIRRIGCRLFAHRAGISLIPLILIVDAFSRESISAAALDLLLVFFVARCVFHPHDVIGRFLSLRPMRFIGKLSYSLYLWQQLFFHYSFVPMFPLNVVATAGLANASYFLLEKPFLKLRSSLRRKASHPETLSVPACA
jgi:peptidoglycan/LPS O-acetylase OafA/YrhL